eukprot:4313-Amorphochlora_amoeboformis.AAC.2
MRRRCCVVVGVDVGVGVGVEFGVGVGVVWYRLLRLGGESLFSGAKCPKVFCCLGARVFE